MTDPADSTNTDNNDNHIEGQIGNCIQRIDQMFGGNKIESNSNDG